MDEQITMDEKDRSSIHSVAAATGISVPDLKDETLPSSESNPVFSKDLKGPSTSTTTADPTEPMETITTTYAGPPDGGYGWVVVVACFLNNFSMLGIMFSWGIFQQLYTTDVFPGQVSAVSWIGTLAFGCMYIFGGVFSLFAAKIGYRRMVLTGSILVAGGLVGASFATSVKKFKQQATAQCCLEEKKRERGELPELVNNVSNVRDSCFFLSLGRSPIPDSRRPLWCKLLSSLHEIFVPPVSSSLILIGPSRSSIVGCCNGEPLCLVRPCSMVRGPERHGLWNRYLWIGHWRVGLFDPD